MSITIQKDGQTMLLLAIPAEADAGLSFVRAVPAEPEDIRAAFATLDKRPVAVLPSLLRGMRAQVTELKEIAATQEASLAAARQLLQPAYHQTRVKDCSCEDCGRLARFFDDTAGRELLEEYRGMRLAIDASVKQMAEWSVRGIGESEGIEVITRLARAIGKTVRVE